MKRKAIRFKGYDWTELLQLQHVATEWPSLPQDFKYDKKDFLVEEDQKSLFLIKEYLMSLTWDENKAKERKLVSEYVRKFCFALSRCKADYSSPVYGAMLKIKNDETLFKWVVNNLESMWN